MDGPSAESAFGRTPLGAETNVIPSTLGRNDAYKYRQAVAWPRKHAAAPEAGRDKAAATRKGVPSGGPATAAELVFVETDDLSLGARYVEHHFDVPRYLAGFAADNAPDDAGVRRRWNAQHGIVRQASRKKLD